MLRSARSVSLLGRPPESPHLREMSSTKMAPHIRRWSLICPYRPNKFMRSFIHSIHRCRNIVSGVLTIQNSGIQVYIMSMRIINEEQGQENGKGHDVRHSGHGNNLFKPSSQKKLGNQDVVQVVSCIPNTSPPGEK